MRSNSACGRIDAERLHVREFLLDLAAIFVRAELVDEDLDPRLVDIVAPAVAIVDAQARLDIAEQVVGGDEVADHRRDHRRAAHAAADEDLRAELAVVVRRSWMPISCSRIAARSSSAAITAILNLRGR